MNGNLICTRKYKAYTLFIYGKTGEPGLLWKAYLNGQFVAESSFLSTLKEYLNYKEMQELVETSL